MLTLSCVQSLIYKYHIILDAALYTHVRFYHFHDKQKIQKKHPQCEFSVMTNSATQLTFLHK